MLVVWHLERLAGSLRELNRIIARLRKTGAGFIALEDSVSSAMLETKKSRKLVQSLPTDCLLTETDRPFTDGVPNPRRPADLKPTRDGLAAALALDAEETSYLISRNLRQLLS